MRRILFIFGALMSICLVSCGQSEQITSDKRKEESNVTSEQEIQKNTGDVNQVIVRSSADYPEYEDAESLVKASDAIFSGIVLDITKEDLCVSKGKDAEKLPYIIYEVKMDTLYKGQVTEEVLKIKHFDTRSEEDVPRIAKGVPYLFLVEVYDDSYPSLVNADQSFFELDAEKKGTKKYNSNRETEDYKISFDDIMAIVSDN